MLEYYRLRNSLNDLILIYIAILIKRKANELSSLIID